MLYLPFTVRYCRTELIPGSKRTIDKCSTNPRTPHPAGNASRPALPVRCCASGPPIVRPSVRSDTDARRTDQHAATLDLRNPGKLVGQLVHILVVDLADELVQQHVLLALVQIPPFRVVALAVYLAGHPRPRQRCLPSSRPSKKDCHRRGCLQVSHAAHHAAECAQSAVVPYKRSRICLCHHSVSGS